MYWGDLDFLLCDLPPGTGDVSISLASFLPGAQMLVVTTPQDAARKVAERAGKMAERTHLRPVGVIENMSWFECPHCGEREEIFGSGGGQEASDTLGVPLVGQIPLYPPLRRGGDEGINALVQGLLSGGGCAGDQQDKEGTSGHVATSSEAGRATVGAEPSRCASRRLSLPTWAASNCWTRLRSSAFP